MATLDDFQTTLLHEVGAGLEGLPDPIAQAVLDMVTPYINLYWEMWRWKSFYPGLHYLYVKRQCLEVLIGRNRDRIQVSIQGASVPQNQILANLTGMRDSVQKEIERSEAIAQASRGPALATMASMTHMDAYGRVFDPYRPHMPQTTRIL